MTCKLPEKGGSSGLLFHLHVNILSQFIVLGEISERLQMHGARNVILSSSEKTCFVVLWTHFQSPSENGPSHVPLFVLCGNMISNYTPVQNMSFGQKNKGRKSALKTQKVGLCSFSEVTWPQLCHACNFPVDLDMLIYSHILFQQ